MIPEQKVKVTWHYTNREYYESRGYLFTKYKDSFYVNVHDLQKKSNVYIKFICDYCNGENQINEKSKYTKFSNLNNQKKFNSKDCCNHKECMAKKLSETKISKSIPKGESFAEIYPEIAKEWNYGKNEKTPYDYKAKSHVIVWWKCSKGHEWDASINNRSRKNNGCPYCSGKRVCIENCLATLKPELAIEWHPTKNGNLTPYDVAVNYSKKVWWLCSKGHEWRVSPNNRSQDQKCPYCLGRLPSKEYNLLIVNPELCLEWDYTKNTKNPTDYTPNTHTIVSWKCKNGHEWNASISNRNKGRGCPTCNESKGESKINEYLTNKSIEFIPQFEFYNLKGIGKGFLKFDFAIFNSSGNLKYLIEYDGEFHFKKQYKDDNFETLVEHDKRKNEYCKNNNIPLLRIPYWDYDNIEEILKKKLIL